MLTQACQPALPNPYRLVRSFACVVAASTVIVVDYPALPLPGRFASFLCSTTDFIVLDVAPVSGRAIVLAATMFIVVGPVTRVCLRATKLQAGFTFVVVCAFWPTWRGLGPSGATSCVRRVAGEPIFGHTGRRVLRCAAATLSVYPLTRMLFPRVLPCPLGGVCQFLEPWVSNP